MAKKENQKVPSKAPQAKTEIAKPASSIINSSVPGNVSPLDRNRAMDGFGILERMVYHNPTATEAFGLTEETINGVGKLIITGTVALLVEAMESGDQFFAERIDKQKRDELLLCAPAFGIKINTAMLPAPDENGEVSIPSSAVTVSQETKDIVAASKKATETAPELDPTKIDNEDDLAKAISYVFHSERKIGVITMFQSAATLLKNWLKIKAGNDEAANKEIDDLTTFDLYTRVTEYIDRALSAEKKTCSLIVDGVGKYAYTQTSVTGSPVQAFAILRCSLKDASGNVPISDEDLAVIMKVIIGWKVRNERIEKNALIAEHEKNLKELKKDKKANANGIADVEQKIKTVKAEIEHLDDIMSFFTNPASDVADNFLEDVKEENKKEDAGRIARAIRGIILAAYYGKSSEILEKYTEESINKNVQMHIGIIINLFRPSTQQIISYKEAFLTELEEKPAPEPEKTPTQKKFEEKKAEKN